MRRRGFLKTLVSAVAAASMEVCGVTEELREALKPPPLRFYVSEEIGVTVANMDAVMKVNFL